MVFTWQIWNSWGYENHATKKWGGRKKVENSSHLHIFSPHLPHYLPWESNLNSYQINMKHDKQTVTYCTNICFFIIIDGYHIKYPYCYCKACIIWAVLKLRSSGRSEKFCLQYNQKSWSNINNIWSTERNYWSCTQHLGMCWHHILVWPGVTTLWLQHTVAAETFKSHSFT